MNKFLLLRTHREFYDEYAQSGREAGASEVEIEDAIAWLIKEARSLLEGKCPKCGAPIVRYVDYKRQHGVSEIPGAWVQYRCSTQPPPGTQRPKGVCDFMADLKEPEASN